MSRKDAQFAVEPGHFYSVNVTFEDLAFRSEDAQLNFVSHSAVILARGYRPAHLPSQAQSQADGFRKEDKEESRLTLNTATHNFIERGSLECSGFLHGATVATMRRGSNRHTVPARIFESHTEPSPTRIASPPSPANCCTTFSKPGSIREIGNSKDVTHTEPSPKAISPPEPGTPTSMVATTLFVFGSTFDTSPLV